MTSLGVGTSSLPARRAQKINILIVPSRKFDKPTQLTPKAATPGGLFGIEVTDVRS
jgi:hypothetical protein